MGRIGVDGAVAEVNQREQGARGQRRLQPFDAGQPRLHRRNPAGSALVTVGKGQDLRHGERGIDELVKTMVAGDAAAATTTPRLGQKVIRRWRHPSMVASAAAQPPPDVADAQPKLNVLQ